MSHPDQQLHRRKPDAPAATAGSLRIAFATVALVIAVFVAGCDRPDVDRMLADAEKALAAGDTTTALSRGRSALEVAPDRADLRTLQGKVLLDSGDASAAEGALRQAMELGGSRDVNIPLLARALLIQKKLQDLLDESAPLMEGPEARPPAGLHAMRGLAQASLGRPEHARASFDQALRLDPDDPDALYGKARFAALDRDLDAAVKLLSRAVEKAPRNADAHALRGDLHRVAGEEEAAAKAYQRALEIAPANHAVRLSLASIHLGARQLDEAVKHIEVVRAAVPESPTAHFLLALVEFRRGNLEIARNLAAKVLAVQPTHTPSLLLVGACAFAARDYVIAEKALRRALPAAPNNLYARKMLAASLSRLGQPQQAIELLAPAVKLSPEDPELRAILGEAYLRNLDYTRATEQLEKAAALAPRSASGRIGVGVARLAAGETDRAIADLQAAHAINPETQEATLLLAMAHMRRREFDRVVQIIDAMEARQRDTPLALNLLGAAQVAQKEFEKARRSLERALALKPEYLPAAMNLAQIDLRDRKVPAALGRIEAVLKKDPGSIQAMFAMARMVGSVPGREEEALRWLERAREASPSAPEPAILLAQYHLERGLRREALEFARQALERKVEGEDTLDQVAQIQVAADGLRDALGTYVRMVNEHPSSAFAHYRLGWTQARTGNQAGARQTLRKAISLKPGYAEPLAGLAQLEAVAGNLAIALKLADDLHALQRDNAATAALKGDLYATAKKPAEAIRAYEAAYAQKRSGALAVKLYLAHDAAGTGEKGSALLTAWLKDNPADMSTRQFLADVSLQSKRYDLAREHYEVLAEEQPRNHRVLNNLAWAYLGLNDPKALPVAERAYRIETRNPLAADTYGWILLQQGDARMALDILRSAASGAPGIADIRCHLGVALAKNGLRKEARAELERALTLPGAFSYRREARTLLDQIRN
jgi:putative PEP-CTERM system TPR-repeat lipoprotein